MIHSGETADEADSEKQILQPLDKSPEIFSSPINEMDSERQSPTNQYVSTDDSESIIASESDDEWKPSVLKAERKIDPEKIIDIVTAEEPLFGPVKEIAEISDYDDDEDQDNSPVNLSDHDDEAKAEKSDKKTPFLFNFPPPDNYSDCDVSVPQTVNKSVEPPSSLKNNTNSSTGAIKKLTNPILPLLSKLKPINIADNKEAAKLIRKLVEYFTFHNSLPRGEKHKHKHRLSEELMAVFSDVLNECCNNIFLSVLESEEFQNKEGKKVKTKSVGCQTVISGDVLSGNLLSETKGKISIGVNSSTKTDIDTVIDLLNEYIVKMNVIKNAE